MNKHHFSTALFLCGLLISSPELHSAQLTRAQVTQTHNEVLLLPGTDTPRPASVGDVVEGATAVRTGKQSRTELQFSDNTIARLGALSVFSFTQGTRDIDLKEGTILLRVPKNAGGAKVKTAAVTAGITGTTVLISVIDGIAKFIVLEGTMRIFLPDRPGESRLIEAGQMVILPLNSKVLPEPVEVNLELLVKTSKLITDFGPLPSFDLINTTITGQNDEVSKGDLVKTNLVILGRGTRLLFSTIEHINDQSQIVIEDVEPEDPEPIPTPTPSTGSAPAETGGKKPQKDKPPVVDDPKFGTPQVYAGTFNIGEGSTIITDPVVLTPVQTQDGVVIFEHQGKIYRGTQQDGPASNYVLGAGSHGLSSEFNALVTAAGQTTVYRFEQLMITGTPEYDTTGGPTSVVLAGLNGLTVNTAMTEVSLEFLPLSTLFLVTNQGPLMLSDSTINSDGRNLVLYSQGNTSIDYTGIDLGSTGNLDGLLAGNQNSISGSYINARIKITSLQSLNITDSILDGPAVSLASRNQDVNIGVTDYFNDTVIGGPDTLSVNINAGGSINITGGELPVYVNAASVIMSASQINLNRTTVGSTPLDENPGNLPKTITLTSSATTGTGIDISNSTQILAALEGGTVTMTTEGADISISGNTYIEGDNVLLRAGGPSTSSVIAMQDTTIFASQRVFLYAGGGPNGRIQFNAGNTNIRSGTGTIMAAQTLQVQAGANVDFQGPGEVYFFGQTINNNGSMTRNGSPAGSPNPSGPYNSRPAFGSQGTIGGTPMFNP